jgi:hypothetical protein
MLCRRGQNEVSLGRETRPSRAGNRLAAYEAGFGLRLSVGARRAALAVSATASPPLAGVRT